VIYDFDEIVDRKNTDSLKYDFASRLGKPENILPLWVADMDFKAPPCVIDALIEKSRHGVFGYSESRQDYFEVLEHWFLYNYEWKIEPAWLVKTPGVVFAICTAIRALTGRGDAVIIQQPVYYPFADSVLLNERKLVVSELIYDDGKYKINFEDFEDKIIENKVKLFILCNPHNPVGRVWTKEELVCLGKICLKHGVYVVSDEIHADFVYPGYKHTVFSDIIPGFSEITVTCTAPTKTFNLAGVQISNIIIQNQKIRHSFKKEIAKTGYAEFGIMGLAACMAAYKNGQEWLEELRKYLYGNLNLLQNFLSEKIKKVRLIEPEGTYLAWLDFKQLDLTESELEDLIVNKAGLWLDKGTMFGRGGEGFQRINIACPRAVLNKALTQLENAI
jgi:cystathionine beta-lyase